MRCGFGPYSTDLMKIQVSCCEMWNVGFDVRAGVVSGKQKGSVAKNLLKKTPDKEKPSCGLDLGSQAKELRDELILRLNVVFFCSLNLSLSYHVHRFVSLYRSPGGLI